MRSKSRQTLPFLLLAALTLGAAASNGATPGDAATERGTGDSIGETSQSAQSTEGTQSVEGAEGTEPPRWFQALGSREDGFLAVKPEYKVRFPEDFDAHPGFRIEWWYITANLRTEAGENLGIQWTLFRNQNTPPSEAAASDSRWHDPSTWMGHAALTTRSDHYFGEKFARGGIGQAGTTRDGAQFTAYIDNWSLTGIIPSDDESQAAFQINAGAATFDYSLRLSSQHPPALHGEKGYSVKSADGTASHYFSLPSLAVEGEVTIDGKRQRVTGQAWLDREWSSQFLSEDQSGWDWFGLKLSDGRRIMVGQVRSGGAPQQPASVYYLAGSLIGPKGMVTPIPPGDIRLTPKAKTRLRGRLVPTGWQIDLPTLGLSLQARALNADSWMPTLVPYWEGPVRLTNTEGGADAGVGYLEMTGY